MTPHMWKLAAFKIACCGSPLVVLLVISGAVAIADLALGAAAIGLVVAGWLLWRRRRRDCACEVPDVARGADSIAGPREATADRDRGRTARREHV